jgi:uncharacterized protein (DUF305 family)
MRSLVRMSIGSGWLAACSLLLFSCAGRNSSSAPPPSVTGPEYERSFLRNRIAHQQAAIEMARACVQKAVQDELKQFCSALGGRESDEAKQLQGWLSQWYGISSQPPAQESATEGYRNFLKSVQTSAGSEFEEACAFGKNIGFFRTFGALQGARWTARGASGI